MDGDTDSFDMDALIARRQSRDLRSIKCLLHDQKSKVDDLPGYHLLLNTLVFPNCNECVHVCDTG